MRELRPTRSGPRGGKSIITLRSSCRDKKGVLHSEICPELARHLPW